MSGVNPLVYLASGGFGVGLLQMGQSLIAGRRTRKDAVVTAPSREADSSVARAQASLVVAQGALTATEQALAAQQQRAEIAERAATELRAELVKSEQRIDDLTDLKYSMRRKVEALESTLEKQSKELSELTVRVASQSQEIAVLRRGLA